LYNFIRFLPGYYTKYSKAAAQQRVPADRFARKIVAFLTPSCAARSRRLNPGR
jgi:hypothetical protein